jgi:hypothetical protein
LKLIFSDTLRMLLPKKEDVRVMPDSLGKQAMHFDL